MRNCMSNIPKMYKLLSLSMSRLASPPSTSATTTQSGTIGDAGGKCGARFCKHKGLLIRCQVVLDSCAAFCHLHELTSLKGTWVDEQYLRYDKSKESKDKT
jgi:hypothetical protein